MKKQSVTRWLPVLLLAGLLVMLPPQSARADTGPKPTMSFSFIYEINQPAEISSSTLLECTDADCANAAPLQQHGPQHFECSTASIRHNSGWSVTIAVYGQCPRMRRGPAALASQRAW